MSTFPDINSVVIHIFPNMIQENSLFKNDCAIIYIDSDTLTLIISKIQKCSESSANDTITKIIELGNLLKTHFNFIYIKLTDTSTIYLNNPITNIVDKNCSFNMSTYFILATGQSWYNRFGLKSIKFEEEFSNNQEIRLLSLKDYLTRTIIKKNLAKLNSDINDGDIDEEKRQSLTESINKKSLDFAIKFESKFFELFTELNSSMNIGEIFSYIKNHNLILSCNDEKTNLIIRIINNSYILKYKEDLQLIL